MNEREHSKQIVLCRENVTKGKQWGCFRRIFGLVLLLGLIVSFAGILMSCRKNQTDPNYDPRRPDEHLIAAIEADPVEKEFTYRTGIYTTRTASFSMKLDRNLYEYYRSLPRYLLYANYVCYMNEPHNLELVDRFVDEILKISEEKGLDDHAVIQQFAAFVQNMDYVHDIDSTGEPEWPKYPIETLYDGGGDCEDLSILLAASLRRIGYKVCFILFNDHVGVGIEDDGRMSGVYYDYDGTRYFYIETTARGWDIGGVPEEYYCLSAKLILVKE